MGESVRIDHEGDLAVLTLNRPEAGNAFSLEMLQAMRDACGGLGSPRAILIRAEGKHFCVGGDVKAFAAAGEGLPSFLRDAVDAFHVAARAIRAPGVPIVAAVKGNAAGGGMSLACLADLVVAGPSSRFVFAYSAIGLSPDGSGSWSLPRIVGTRVALDLFLTNRPVGVDEAKALGIVSRIVDDDQVDAEARALATQLAAGPTASFIAGKRLIEATTTLEEALDLELESMTAMGATSDGQEGVAAFTEKRPPTFGGR